MNPDPLFLILGAVNLIVSVTLAIAGRRPERRAQLLASLFWPQFGAGLFVEAFAPRLRIENNAFVMPQRATSSGKTIDPAAIVAQERRMQAFAALLAGAGAIGLAFHYRRALFPKRS